MVRGGLSSFLLQKSFMFKEKTTVTVLHEAMKRMEKEREG